MIVLIFLFPKIILGIFICCSVVAIVFTFYCASTAKDLPTDLTDDESYDLFNVNREGKDNER